MVAPAASACSGLASTTSSSSKINRMGGSEGGLKDNYLRPRPPWRGTVAEMAAATTPEALARNDGLVDKVLARVRKLWLRDPHFAEAGDVSAWNWASVGEVGRSDRARLNGNRAAGRGGETGMDLAKTQMMCVKPIR